MSESEHHMNFIEKVVGEVDLLVLSMVVGAISRSNGDSRSAWVEAIADEARETGKIDWRERVSFLAFRRVDRALTNRVLEEAKNEFASRKDNV